MCVLGRGWGDYGYGVGELHGAVWELHEFWISRAGMLVFLCVLSWVGVGLFSVHLVSIVGARSCNKERPPSLSVSVAVTHDIICTDLMLHFFFFFSTTLDLYVYVVISDGGFVFLFLFPSCQFLAGTFLLFLGEGWVSLHCAVTFCRDSLLSLGETLFVIPAYTRSDWMISRWPMHAPWTWINPSDETVCCIYKL